MPKRLTTEQFIEKARAVHGDKYDYSKVVYVGSKSKVEIVCKKHGSFLQTSSDHTSTRGSGCPKCGKELRLKNIRKTQDQILEIFKKVHGDHYDYSRVVYRGNENVKIEIGCPKHGFFLQSAHNHKKGHGCNKCGEISSGLKKRQKLAGVIEEFKRVHGDRYDYSRVEYVSSHTKVELVCKEHGSFWQTPANHKGGTGCPSCRSKYFSETRSFSLDEAVENWRKAHGDRYDYSKVVYVNAMTKVEIICKEHGSFWQRPESHKRGQGCIKCGYKSISEKKNTGLEQTIKDFKEVHGDRYDYSKVVYDKATTKVEIICEEHGSFWQAPSIHKRGHGCPKCLNNQSENLFGECLEELGYKASKQRPKWLRNPKTGYPLELDYYIPELKIAFEVQGRQHYKAIDHWGGVENFQQVQERDQQKRTLCFMKGVTLYEYDLRLGKDKESMMTYLTKILKPKTQTRSFHDQILELIQKR